MTRYFTLFILVFYLPGLLLAEDKKEELIPPSFSLLGQKNKKVYLNLNKKS
jgi:hypothetical protein